MEITIAKENINKYKTEINNNVTKINWQAGEFDRIVLENFPSLLELDCFYNKITSLDAISNLVNLQKLYCSDNQITSLQPLIYLRRLTYLYTPNNPLEPQTIQIERMLNRIHSNSKTSIYQDNQNVHDTTIQRTVSESIKNLLLDPKPIFSVDDLINSTLNKSTIQALIEYGQDQTIHSHHLITYHELLSYVWIRISKSFYKDELLKILEEQIADAECKCFTGRFNRTLSVLVGFYPDIYIEISDRSRIGAIVLTLKNQIKPYNVKAHQELAKRGLLAAGYSEIEIESWIMAIEDTD